MERLAVLDQGIMEKWQSAFNLKGRGNNLSPIIAATLALGTLAHEVPPGFFLARQKLVVNGLIPQNAKVILKGEMLKGKDSTGFSYLTCKGQVIRNDIVLLELDSTLIKVKGAKKHYKYAKESFVNSGARWRSFSAGEIKDFATLSGDPNPIHTGEKPVVPGMLLLLALEDEFPELSKNRWQWNIQYLHPVRSNEEIEISGQRGIITGIVNQKKCFVINMEGIN